MGVGTFTRSRIVASALTTNDVEDGAQASPLLDQVTGPVASFTGDGAYDQEGVYAGLAERHPEAAVVVPPRSTAVPSETAETAPTRRDRHLRCIAEHGRMGWQKRSGYNKRARAEAAIGRWKRVIGEGLRARARTKVGQPRWTLPSTCSTACWSSDARATSASHEPKRGWGDCAHVPDPCTTAARGHSYGRTLRSVADQLLELACVLLRRQMLFDPNHGAPMAA